MELSFYTSNFDLRCPLIIDIYFSASFKHVRELNDNKTNKHGASQIFFYCFPFVRHRISYAKHEVVSSWVDSVSLLALDTFATFCLFMLLVNWSSTVESKYLDDSTRAIFYLFDLSDGRRSLRFLTRNVLDWDSMWSDIVSEKCRSRMTWRKTPFRD